MSKIIEILLEAKRKAKKSKLEKSKSKKTRSKSRFSSGRDQSAEGRAKRSIDMRARYRAQKGDFVRPIPGGYSVIDAKKKTVVILTPSKSHRYLVNKGNRDKVVGTWKKGPKVHTHKQTSRAVLRNRKRTRPVQSYSKRYKKN